MHPDDMSWAVAFSITAAVIFAIQGAIWATGCYHRRETRLKNIEYELKFRTDFEKKARGEARLHSEATLTGFIHQYDIGRGSE